MNKEIERILNSPSCYPDYIRKGREVRKKELEDWYEKYHEINEWYNLYGMDRVDSDSCDAWLDSGIFVKQRYEINSSYYPTGSKYPYNYTILMRDKRAFEMLMLSIYGSRPVYQQSCAVIQNGTVFLKDEHTGSLEKCSSSSFIRAFENQKIVIKNTFGFGGDGIFVASVTEKGVLLDGKLLSVVALTNYLNRKCSHAEWIIQLFIKQHDILSRFNASSVNTMRIITFNTGKRMVATNAVLRFGKPGSVVDNGSHGGVFTSVDNDGIVGDDVFDYSLKTRTPNPHVGTVIPFFEKARKLVLCSHERIPQLFTIGWDIAFTPVGPVILEGNDGWGTHISQAPYGYALRNLWEECLKERKDYFGL